MAYDNDMAKAVAEKAVALPQSLKLVRDLIIEWWRTGTQDEARLNGLLDHYAFVYALDAAGKAAVREALPFRYEARS